MSNFQTLMATLILAATASAVVAQAAKGSTVAALQDKHDRALILDLKAYT